MYMYNMDKKKLRQTMDMTSSLDVNQLTIAELFTYMRRIMDFYKNYNSDTIDGLRDLFVRNLQEGFVWPEHITFQLSPEIVDLFLSDTQNGNTRFNESFPILRIRVLKRRVHWYNPEGSFIFNGIKTTPNSVPKDIPISDLYLYLKREYLEQKIAGLHNDLKRYRDLIEETEALLASAQEEVPLLESRCSSHRSHESENVLDPVC